MNNIIIFLNSALPDIYRNPSPESGEAPVKDVNELCELYRNKYASFGSIVFHIYDPADMIPFIKALNDLFKSQGSVTKVDARLLKSRIDDLTPLLVVDGEIVSRGVYPDLTTMRGGTNSISRGGTGLHEH